MSECQRGEKSDEKMRSIRIPAHPVASAGNVMPSESRFESGSNVAQKRATSGRIDHRRIVKSSEIRMDQFLKNRRTTTKAAHVIIDIANKPIVSEDGSPLRELD